MGRALPAALPDADLAERLERIEVRPLTARTVASRDDLRTVIEQVRRQGYAITDQELEEGLRSLAVPVHDASGATVAALNISVHASRASLAELRSRFLPPAREAGAAIDAELRRSGLGATGGAARGGRGAGARPMGAVAGHRGPVRPAPRGDGGVSAAWRSTAASSRAPGP